MTTGTNQATSKSPRAKKADELDVMFPDAVVKTKGGSWVVSPFYFKDFKRVLELVNKYIKLLPEGGDSLFQMIVTQAEDGIKDVQEFLQLCCPITDEAFAALRMDELIDLFMTAVEVNRDFLLLRIRESGLKSMLTTGAMDRSLDGATSSAD